MLFPQILRVLTVIYGVSRKKFSMHDWMLRFIQSIVCIALIALAVFDMWILDPENTHILRFQPKTASIAVGNNIPPWGGLVLPHWRQTLLGCFQRLCYILLVWCAIAYV
jgi:hypothetical protein